ncbi:MAG TPA: helix-turn-helix domain-containing protein [Nitriliruptoraceae bacterium]|nr:helix-turn-helix domain-containing protein [Nitriliruptoraceae bacterium]
MAQSDPREWLDDLEVVELDSAQLRALAHPTRSRIVSSLRLEGPATSAGLATRLGTNSGQTSYHLRALADVDLVVEDPDRGTARERWWRAAQRGHSWAETAFDDNPEDRHAADWLLRHYHRLYTQWISEWFEQRHQWPTRWREAASHGDAFMLADPELLDEFNRDLEDLVERYHERGNALDPDRPDVHRVTFIHHGFPSEHLRP